MRTTATRLTALAGATVLAVPTALLVAGPASAARDIDRQGACGTGSYELSVDKERGGFEVDASLDNVAAFSTWKVTMKHEGKTYLTTTRKADDEGELDVESFRKNTKGKDTFSFSATRVGGSEKCSATVVRR